MRIVKRHDFGEVEGFELGYAPIGKPLMNVLFYITHGVMIDSGQANCRKSALAIAKEKAPRALLLTHAHEDHSGNAAAIKRALAIEVYGHRKTVESMRKTERLHAYQRLVWGQKEALEMKEVPEPFTMNGLTLLPIFTPGHSKDLTVYLEKNRGWLFSGDLYLGDKIKYFRSVEEIGQQIGSIEKVLQYDFDKLFCAHRPQVENAKEHLRRKLDFLLEFRSLVLETYEKGVKQPRAIMKQLKLKEQWLVKAICMGDCGVDEMVKSSIRSRKETR